MTKVKYCLLIGLALFHTSNAQIGFGTANPHESSVIDLNADDRGLLIPRVNLKNLKNPKITGTVRDPSAAEALLIYNKTEVKEVSGKVIIAKGFYYWNGHQWQPIYQRPKNSDGRFGMPPQPIINDVYMNGDLEIDKNQHQNAVISGMNGRDAKIIIPDDLPNGFEFKVIGATNGKVYIAKKKGAKIAIKSRLGSGVAVLPNGIATVALHKDVAGNVNAHINGDMIKVWGATQKPFVTIWEMTKLNKTLEFKFDKRFSRYDYDVDWGDGHTDIGVKGEIKHTYTFSGEKKRYEVKIAGLMPRFMIKSDSDRKALISVKKFGDIQWESTEMMFDNCKNMTFANDIDIPNLSKAITMRAMFRKATAFNQDISTWDVSNVTNMEELFKGATAFNQNISTWDVSKVTTCTEFNKSSGLPNSYCPSLKSGCVGQ